MPRSNSSLDLRLPSLVDSSAAALPRRPCCPAPMRRSSEHPALILADDALPEVGATTNAPSGATAAANAAASAGPSDQGTGARGS
eukprot:13308076-Heterocapsa_arctica.AAC.1